LLENKNLSILQTLILPQKRKQGILKRQKGNIPFIPRPFACKGGGGL